MARSVGFFFEQTGFFLVHFGWFFWNMEGFFWVQIGAYFGTKLGFFLVCTSSIESAIMDMFSMLEVTVGKDHVVIIDD